MSDGKVFKIFVVNPGSTSTKVEFFENEKSIVEANVFHDSTILSQFKTINDQLDYRMEVVRKWLADNNVDLTGVDAIVGRGGACYPIEGGTYEVDDRLVNDIREAKGGVYHSSMLGIQMAKQFHDEFGGRLLMVDPIVVDEYQDVARITGVKGIYKLNASINCGGGLYKDDGSYNPKGLEKVCEAAEWMLGGIPVDYYYAVTMTSLKDLVDLCGGLDYDMDIKFHIQGR